MTKEQLISDIAEECGVTRAVALRVVDSLTAKIVERAKNGDETTLSKFGSFRPAHRAARVGRNPKTGEPLQIEASTTLQFKVSSKVRETLS